MLIATHQLSNLKVFQHINTEQIQRKSLETIKLGVAQELLKTIILLNALVISISQVVALVMSLNLMLHR